MTPIQIYGSMTWAGDSIALTTGLMGLACISNSLILHLLLLLLLPFHQTLSDSSPVPFRPRAYVSGKKIFFLNNAILDRRIWLFLSSKDQLMVLFGYAAPL